MKVHKIFKVMLLLLFIGHYSNITLFYHTHIIDGITYCHSHFYGLGNSNKPTAIPHNSNQLQLIKELNQITWNSDIIKVSVETPIFHLLIEFLCPALQQHSLYPKVYTTLRAPPSFVV